MRFSIVSRLRNAPRKRAFLRDNPDIRKVLQGGDRYLKSRAHIPTPLSASQIDHWNEFGFLILDGFFEQSLVADYKRHIDKIWQERAGQDNPLVMYSYRGAHFFRDAEDEDRMQPYRLLDQYLIDLPTRNICMDPGLADILHQLMGHPPVVCNSLLFEWGSEQDMHSDMFYMPPVSENQMLATWLALDDVTEDNGPLLYVPGSHKLPSHRFSHGRVDAVTEEVPDAVAAIETKLAELGLHTERFFAKRGDVLIWHSQLMHGGDTIRDRTARRTSLVTHYYSTCDVPRGSRLCAERDDGSLLLVKDHLPIARAPEDVGAAIVEPSDSASVTSA